MFEHHDRRPEGADRIGHALAHDVECRTVDRLEHRRKRPLRIEIGRWRDAERARERCGEIRQDIGVQVGRHDRVDRLRPHHHAHGHGVDQHLVPAHVFELAGDLHRDLVPHHHGVTLRVRLGDDGQELSRPRLGQAEGEPHDPLDAGAGEHRHIRRGFQRRALVHPAADAGVFALGVLAHDDPIELAAVDVAQRRRDPRQHARRPHIGVLIERLADGKPQAPQGDVVGHVGRPDRAEVNCVMILDLIAPVGGHHDAMPLVVIRAPVEMIERECKAAVARCQRFQDLDTGRDDFFADAVARDGGDFVGFHGLLEPRTRAV